MVLPQLSTMDKLSVTYQHGTLQTDISNLQTSEVEILEINWSDDASSQKKYTRCRDEVLSSLESHEFPKVKRLVLNNLFYSKELVKDLTRKFPNIEHLKILPFNPNNGSYHANFFGFSALRELEMTLGYSGDIMLLPPASIEGTHCEAYPKWLPNLCRMHLNVLISVHASHSSLCKCSYG